MMQVLGSMDQLKCVQVDIMRKVIHKSIVNTNMYILMKNQPDNYCIEARMMPNTIFDFSISDDVVIIILVYGNFPALRITVGHRTFVRK